MFLLKKYGVYDIETDEIIATFDSKKQAEIWCEENGVDYDYYKIREIRIGKDNIKEN